MRSTIRALLLFPLAVIAEVRGCGLDWNLPANHFDGVDSYGYVSYWERIGEIDCGNGLKLPLQINFSSARDDGPTSPYLGQGWLFPLLESKFVQASEDRFYMMQPDGLNNLFLRAEPNGTVLNGSAGWKAELKDNVITAWASCGWKLVFTAGRLSSVTTPGGRQLSWVYEGKMVSEIREGIASILKVDYESNGRIKTLLLPKNEQVLVSFDQKPRVVKVANQNVVADTNFSLGQLALVDGKERGFSYGTDEAGQPAFNVTYSEEEKGVENAAKVRNFTWDATTKHILSDGKWKYAAMSTDNPNVVDLRRTSLDGKLELWERDSSAGTETTQGATGEKIVVYRFISGVAAGKVRQIITTEASGKKRVDRFDYDLNGKILRQQLNGVIQEYSDGHFLQASVNGKVIWREIYDKSGKFVKLMHE